MTNLTIFTHHQSIRKSCNSILFVIHNSLIKGIVCDSDNIFYDMSQKMLTKKVISKISIDSNFTLTSYA